MHEYVLRWQVGLFNDEIKMHYTYGNKEMLESKAKKIIEDKRVLFVSIDKVEVLKDIRSQKIIEYLEKNTITRK